MPSPEVPIVQDLRPTRRPSILECPCVLIAGDRAATRAGIRLALEQDGFVVSGEPETADDAVAAALHDPPDLCLLDAHLPGGAIEAAAAIRSERMRTRVVIIGEPESDHELFASLDSGAAGWLSEGIRPERLGPALRDVLGGGSTLPRAVTARVVEELRRRSWQGQPGLVRRSATDLTNREWQVLDCLREGLSTRRVAKQLFITETTVRRHVGSILRKLEVPTREAAVRLVARRSRNLNGE